MSYRNFAAQAIPHIEDFARTANAQRLGATASFALWLAKTMRGAQHFSLPDGATLFNDELRGLVGEDLHLPFPAITVECVNNDASSVLPGQVFTPRRLAIAVDRDPLFAPIFQKMGLDNGVAVFAVSEMDGMWLPDATGVALCHILESPLVQTHGLIAVHVFVTMPELFEASIRKYGSRQAALTAVQEDQSIEARAVCELLEALSCSNVTTERFAQASASVNRKRESKGKAALLDYHVLVLDRARGEGVSRAPMGDRSSPRQHLRRGHIRRYVNGKKLWINSMLVGRLDHGVVSKDYEARV